MKHNYYLLPQAERDIEGIALYTIHHWGKLQAKRYAANLIDSLEKLAQSPCMGRDASHLRAGYRLIQSGSDFIFYQPADRGIIVIRILHQQMNADLHL